MPKTFADLMRDARSLVSSQRLDEATAAIQEALGGAKASRRAAPYEGLTLEREAEGRAPGRPASSREPASIAAKLAPFLDMRPRFKMPEARPHAPPVDLPDGARYEAHVHTAPAGSRAYKLYVPAALPAGPRPLLLMLHGCTQNPDDFARGTRMNAMAEEAGFLVAYPEQPPSANARHCWNWFEPAHQRRDLGEPAILAGIVAEITSEHAVDRSRVFVAGLSAGGAMAAVLGATYPELFAGVGVHSGLPYGVASDVGSALSVMRSGKGAVTTAAPGAGGPRVIVFHGDSDRTVHPANGEGLTGPTVAGLRETVDRGVSGGRGYARLVRARPDGSAAVESWSVEGLGHAWSGGDAGGSFADPEGPDASREMIRFFLEGGRRP